MAEEQDQDQKTEDASSRRLDKAREEGQLPLSQEVRTWFVLVAGLVVVMMAAPYLGVRMRDSLIVYLSGADQLATGDGSITRALLDTMKQIGPILSLVILVFMAAGVGGTMLQTGPFASTSLLAIKWDKINPIAGWKRLFSMQSVVEFLKGALKITLVGIVVYVVVKPLFKGVELLNGLEPALQVNIMYDYTVKILVTVIAVFTIIVAADLMYQRFSFFRKMRMTKQEVKEENKEMMGDPIVRMRIARLRMEKARRRMMSAVPDASVVITNPTHFAIALKYDREKMAAPMVVAKGQDVIALKIKEIALANEVPVMENPPLARALYASCDIDEAIPVEHYKAVSEIISYLYKLKRIKI